METLSMIVYKALDFVKGKTGLAGVSLHNLASYMRNGSITGLRIKTHLTIAEKITLYSLALQSPKHCNIVELGSYLGSSSIFLGVAAKVKNGRLYCIDTWQNDAMGEGKRDTWKEFNENTKSVSDYLTAIRATTISAADSFDEPINLLFIDADHSYEAVKADTLAWGPKVKSGGWIVFHDWEWAEGVQAVVNDIIKPIQCSDPVVLPNMYATRIIWKDR